ncbi:MAG: chemotaxis protein, partial [Verrucomicrobia bacterium]|nr:chemotaxis protein [Verrucomicrobiota bacterium]
MTHVVQKKVGYEKTVAVGQMDQVTQGVAANAEQNASVSVELSNQASLLGNTIHDLQQLISN